METKFNFNSQICTNKIQSERLLTLGLKKETADCYLFEYEKGKYKVIAESWLDLIADEKYYSQYKDVCFPAWSLHRLWDILPKDVEVDDDCYAISHLEGEKDIVYHDYGYHCYNFDRKNNIYDNIIDCIEWLIKEGYFNKEYLV